MFVVRSTASHRRYGGSGMRRSGILTLVLLAFAVPGAAAAAPWHVRPLCIRYRCRTVAQDSRVRVLRVQSRHPRNEEESEEGIRWLHFAVWKATGRAWPLGDFAVTQDSSGVQMLMLAGPWVGYVESGCSHETLSCNYAVERMDARSGRRETQPNAIPNEQAPLPPQGEGCLNGALPPTALALAESGTVAWIEYGHVCELPHGSQVPVLLSAGPGVEPRSLLMADGFFIWREGAALRSTPAG
jgi:hypothetical protein